MLYQTLLNLSIAIWGNAYLSRKHPLSLSEVGKNEYLAETDNISFSKLEESGSGKARNEVLLYTSVVDWMKSLENNHCHGMRIDYHMEPDIHVERNHQVGFFVFETIGPNGSDYWQAISRFTTSKTSGEKEWHYRFILYSENVPTPVLEKPSLSELSTSLTTNLELISDFAKKHNICAPFNSALKTLSKQTINSIPFDICPAYFLDTDARRLLSAALDAWCFGGMGSWNDHSFSGDAYQSYEKLSNELYSLLMQAYSAAANSCIAQKIQGGIYP